MRFACLLLLLGCADSHSGMADATRETPDAAAEPTCDNHAGYEWVEDDAGMCGDFEAVSDAHVGFPDPRRCFVALSPTGLMGRASFIEGDRVCRYLLVAE